MWIIDCFEHILLYIYSCTYTKGLNTSSFNLRGSHLKYNCQNTKYYDKKTWYLVVDLKKKIYIPIIIDYLNWVWCRLCVGISTRFWTKKWCMYHHVVFRLPIECKWQSIKRNRLECNTLLNSLLKIGSQNAV